MPIRISGVYIKGSHHIVIGLTSIFGIGRSTSHKICSQCNIKSNTQVDNLSDKEVDRLRDCLKNYLIEGDLRRSRFLNLKRLTDINCYRGRRRMMGLPVRGQRTRSNANTSKRLNKQMNRLGDER